MGEAPDVPAEFDTSWFASYEGRTLRQAVDSAESEGRPYRVIGPDTAVTADFRTNRLNLVVDADGNLTGMHPG